jgi:HlyD family secretion protein
MKRLVAFFVILVAGGAGAYYYYVYGQAEEKPQIMQLSVSQGDILETVQSTGTLEAIRTFPVGSQVSGLVKAIHADFNAIVKEGELIAEIDPLLLQTQVNIQTANILRQEGDIANQRVQLEQDIKQLERTKELHAKGLVTELQLEQAELAVSNRKAQITSAERSLVSARANLEQAELNVSYTKIKSPVTGVVVNRHVDVGQAVQSSMSSPQFFTIATDLRELRLTAGVDESEIGRVRRGMPVRFTVDTYEGVEFEGVVDSVRLNATNQNNVVTYPVRITVPNPDLRLKPSMTAQVRIIISTARNVVRVPVQATRFRPNDAIYTGLGIVPPQAGRGSGPGRGGDEDNGRGVSNQPNQQGPGSRQGGDQAQAQQPGTGAAQATDGGGRRGGGDRAQPGEGGGTRPGRSGFGGGGGNLTSEQRQALAARFGGAGGRGGGQGGGRNRAGGQGAAANANAQRVELQAEMIDDLFPELPRRIQPGSVWTWNEEAKDLRQIRIETGVTDGTWMELVRGDLKPGQQVVTGVILPQPRTASGANNSLFGGQQGGRGMGGMTPGGGPGGGGGRGGGGGGGGRGGGRN